jgi:peptide/nickel transport system substrate-binding protein
MRIAHTLLLFGLAVGFSVGIAAGAPATAKTLRVASAFDPQTMDPHALALLYHTRVITQVYEHLVTRSKDFQLEPQLATAWESLDGGRRWRFKLRPGVKFHDGTPLTADDVVFSLERSAAAPSQRNFHLRNMTGVRRVDDLTVDVLLNATDAVLPEKTWLIAIMSKAWATKHNVLKAQDYNGKQETYAVRNVNGTGPFKLQRYEPDARTVLLANRDWWGWKQPGLPPADKAVSEVHYVVMFSDATRLAALASGEVDLVLDPPFQDVARLKQDKRVKLTEVTDIGIQYIGFDQARNELEGSDIRGRNPFKDVRVRRAVYQAIDVDLILQKVLRGQAHPTGAFVSRLVDGYDPKLAPRLKYDPAAARALLNEAGYAEGFGVVMDCVNTAFREAVCQAVAAMLAQVGIRVRLQSTPAAQFFPKLTQATTSFYEVGWTPGTDPYNIFAALFRTHDNAGNGTFNAGRYSNPKLDALIDAIRVEPNLDKRRALIGEALQLLNTDLPMVPLYHRTLAWAMRRNISLVHLPNDVLDLRWVQVD